MSRRTLLSTLVVLGSVVAASVVLADQGRRPSPQPRPRPPVVVRGEVFVGGYFYDPVFGPYPWWPHTGYPYWYFPRYDERAFIRIKVEPDHAAVYVDGFFAGVVDDFDGLFDGLPLTPGGHTLVFYLDGYRTLRRNLYVPPGASFSVRELMEPLRPGEANEPPTVVPPVPEPPAGSYRVPLSKPPSSAASEGGALALPMGPHGTLDLSVQPVNAMVIVDGERWASSDGTHFNIQLRVGTHRVEVTEAGYQRFITDVVVREGETSKLNVTLTPGLR
jgi:hypothetical protein